MDENLHRRIQHEIAELRAVHPLIAHCNGVLEDWDEAGERRYALRLEIRWPEHQTLLSSGAHTEPYAALRAAFDAAGGHMAKVR